MNKITLIAAIGKNRELGYNNDLIWNIPEDLKFFKDNTLGKYMVMGINTFNSLPGILPGRKHIVLTRKNVDLGDEIYVIHNLDELLQYIDTLSSEVMIIGGASIYRQMINYADRMLLTEIDSESMADVYFPEFSMEEWDRTLISSHNYNNIEYSHLEYTRKRVK